MPPVIGEREAGPAPDPATLPMRQRRPGAALVLAALFCALFVSLPVLYLILRAAQASPETWRWLLSERLPGLLSNSLQLTAGATLLAVLISVPLACLVMRTDLPGRRWLMWIAALPLVFPAYIGAFSYITIFGPRSPVEAVLSRLTGTPGHLLWRPEIYSLWGAVLIIGIFTYPYIYLLLCSALRGSNQSLEEAARSTGLRPLRVFWRVTFPLLRPALAAGALLVSLYAISDFGTVAMLRVETFTSAIFLQLQGRFDRSAAAILSLVLLVLTVLLLAGEARIHQQGTRYYQTTGQWKPARPIPLGRWKLPATLFAWSVAVAGVALPASILVYWSVLGLEEGLVSARFFQAAWHSVAASGAAAALAMAMGLPLAYFACRYPNWFSHLLFRSAYIGYALPGVVVALATIFFFHRFVNPVYGTVWVLIAAYLIRFLPQSMGATHAGLGALSPRLEDAGRSLGMSGLQVLRRVTLPLIAPSLITGGAIVFLNALKELPATLLLRPAGFDTLAVRVWMEASEGFYARAAPSALLLIVLAAVPMALLLRRVFRGQAQIS